MLMHVCGEVTQSVAVRAKKGSNVPTKARESTVS